MEPMNFDTDGRSGGLRIKLSAEDLEILDRLRGKMPVQMFLPLLLRMLDSGRILSKPPWNIDRN